MGVTNYHLCLAKVISSACWTCLFSVLPTWLCIWPLLLGWLLGCQNQPIENTCDSLLSFCSIGIWWKGTSTITSCWSSLLGASTSCIPFVWKCGYSCGWTISQTSCYNASNSNCLLRLLVTILNISQKSLIQVSFGQ